MKQLTIFMIFFTFTLPTSIFAQSISGTVHYDKKATGTLFVYIRYLDRKGDQPLAIKRFENPKFPLPFKLSVEDAIVPGTPFMGPFRVMAKLTPVGRIWSEGVTFAKGESDEKKPVNVGDNNIVVELY